MFISLSLLRVILIRIRRLRHVIVGCLIVIAVLMFMVILFVFDL